MMNFELIQPWATFVMKTKLPSNIVDSFLKISDEIIASKESDAHELLAGQIDHQYWVDEEMWHGAEWDYLTFGCQNYVQQSNKQSSNKTFPLDSWMIRMTSMWVNSQYDNEYFPIHKHMKCHIAGVFYLKVPEMLPTRQKYVDNDGVQDGCIEFINNTSTDPIFSHPCVQIPPQVGDLFIFSSKQHHQVYPFRTPDGKGERRSVSFNAEFIPIAEAFKE